MPPAGADSPGRAYLTFYRVLPAAQAKRARVSAGQANELLQAQAAATGQAGQQRAFLEDVPAHGEIIAAFSATESIERQSLELLTRLGKL